MQTSSGTPSCRPSRNWAKADLLVQFTEVKKGRSVNSLRFSFVPDPQGRLDV